MNTFIVSSGNNPYQNLGLEEYLLDNCGDGVTFYLWQNASTVVIGYNQNAYKECDLAAMNKDGIKLARRKTGGGAVYHNLGNLNFSFIAKDGVYNVKRQTSVIVNALKKFGIAAEISGRNDLTVDGKKFSGNAYLSRKGTSLHHGTLLVDENKDDIGRYLTASQLKLSAKGVESVKSRVINLLEIAPEITQYALSVALTDAFGAEYGDYETVDADELDYSAYALNFADADFILGKNPKTEFNFVFKTKENELYVSGDVKTGKLTNVSVFGDCMDTSLPSLAQKALDGVPFEETAIALALKTALNLSLDDGGKIFLTKSKFDAQIN